MVNVCTSEQFTEDGGILGLSPFAFAAPVAQTTATSTGDGTITAHPGAGGRALIDASLHWANTYPCPVRVQPILRKQRRALSATASNILVVRDRATTLVGTDAPGVPITAVDPDPTAVFDSEWGGGNIVGAAATGDATPRVEVNRFAPQQTVLLQMVSVGAGESISVRFKARMYMPYGAGAAGTFHPSTDANDVNSIAVLGTSIEFVAYPTAL
ncbi:hypothetical protein LZP97_26930 (plasmid) [Rhodococcus sp. DMF-1]|uniref:DUF7172 family protein n=1 Tax=Rhodococcus TaxID=1827 RepID=UPI0006614296|nr:MULTISPECIES: hypothetical protein [Rhodococcus]UIR36972.1 hypothetical protein LZP97_25900 [Rhodococcus sp. DMF-1]UIR37007.1 hypothetical protein LZP97_00065 [Rhodococcus sp. DMF-1]UIR39821.1 hypothetical protein LZP97_26930 [Rhodococcus sp. DMF-1]